MVKKTFWVMGMHCSGCPMEIESIEDDLPGIKKVEASYKKAQMVVEYDEALVNESQIIEAVKHHGYEAEVM